MKINSVNGVESSEKIKMCIVLKYATYDVLKGISFSLAKTLTPHELVQVARQLGSMRAFHVL